MGHLRWSCSGKVNAKYWRLKQGGALKPRKQGENVTQSVARKVGREQTVHRFIGCIKKTLFFKTYE